MDTNRFALIEIDSDDYTPEEQAQAAEQRRRDITKGMPAWDAGDVGKPAVSKPVGFQLPAPAQAVAMAAAATVAAPPAPVVAPPSFGDWGNTGIDSEGADRAKAADAIAQRVGLRFASPTLFAWGTRMISAGVNAHRHARAELHAMPLLSKLADDAQTLIAKEGRRGDVTPLAGVLYGVDDKLRTKPSSGGAPVGVQALKQLLGRANAPGGAYLADGRVTGALRAPHVTHWLDLHRVDEAATCKAVEAANIERRMSHQKPIDAPEPKRVKLLSKLDTDGQRVLYGVVGAKYPHGYGMDAVIRDVMKKLPSDVRGSLFYDAATTQWRVDAALGTEFTPVVGDVHRVGIKFGAHDAGGGAYWASLYAIRVRCVNFTQIRAGKKLGRVRHVGSVEALQERVKSLVEVGAEAIRAYSDLWAEANQTAIISETDAAGGDARKVFEALIEAGHLPALDGREAAIERYFSAWLKEPGQNRSDYVNAATRAAHEAPWSSPWASDDIEEAASQMLYQHVLLTPAQIAAVM